MIEYYRQILEIVEPELSAAIKKSKTEESDILITLFSFNYELSKIVPATSNFEIASVKYEWWENEINNALDQKTDHQHEILKSLKDLSKKHNFSKSDFQLIFEARKYDLLEEKSLKNTNELESYIDGYLYQVFAIYINAKKIKLSKEEKNFLKKICHIQKIFRILHSLKNHSYNKHPFISKDITKELAKFHAIERQTKTYEILQNYLKEKYDYVTNDNLFLPDEILNNYSKAISLQARNYLKYKSLDKLFPYDYNDLLKGLTRNKVKNILKLKF